MSNRNARQRILRGLAATALATAALLAGSANASARAASRSGSETVLHLRLVKSAPSKGQVLTASPTLIQLWFSLPPEMAVTVVRLSDADGKAIPLGAPTRGTGAKDPVEVEVKQALAAGNYTVSWKTSSKDGHPITGDVGFSVKAAAN